MQLRFENKVGYLLVTATGEYSFAGFKQMITEIFAEALSHGSAIALLDMRPSPAAAPR
ncbi:MAG: hypothetical protein H6978_14850 [Gammaproteobacteria bacterium]|nr:hypothetical protein [Gammaproteobacteria bacterium]